jgi:calcium-dependent protein kinase
MGCNGASSKVQLTSIEDKCSKSKVKGVNSLLDHKAFVIQNNGDIHDSYKFMKLLGKGSYGEVIHGIHRVTGQDRAIKILNKFLFDDQIEAKNIEDEFKILRTMEHPNIVKVYEIFEDNKYLYIVMELLKGGEVFSMLLKEETLKPEIVACIIRQTLQAVAYLHAKKICHRDIKPHNLLLESKEGKTFIKLCDFGTAKLFNKDKYFKDIMGTPYFMAPEVIKGSPYNYKVDIWSIGIMTFLLITGRLPFKKNEGKLDKSCHYEEEIINFKFTDELFKPYPHLSKGFIDFESHCLSPNPDERWECGKLLEHPWIISGIEKEFGTEELIKATTVNIKNFNNLALLERAVFTFLMLNYSSEEEKELRELFIKLDKSHNGKLERNEFQEVFNHNCIKQVYSKLEIDNIFDEIDSNHSGKIGYNEFIQAAVSKSALITDKKLMSAFSYFDKQGDGMISKDDLKEVFQSGGIHLEVATLQLIVNEIDTNKDSKISFDEFKKMMVRLLSK